MLKFKGVILSPARSLAFFFSSSNVKKLAKVTTRLLLSRRNDRILLLLLYNTSLKKEGAFASALQIEVNEVLRG